MITMKFLKGVNYLCVTLCIVLAILFLVNLFGNSLYISDGRFFSATPQLITIPFLIIFSLIISTKSNQQKGVMLFALFLSLISIDWLIQFLRHMNNEWIPFSWVVITNAITGTVNIKALQSFPRQLVTEDATSVFPKNKLVRGYINWAIKDYTWLLFSGLLVGFSVLHMSESWSDMLILLTSSLCIYVNYKQSSAEERQKIMWLFWGVISFTFIMSIYPLLHLSSGEISPQVKLLFNIMLMLVLLLSLVMSLFFSNTFDTGVLIRRTLVDGLLFILIVITYNTVEHYFLHWLSHELEISDVVLSSFLSGIFVLAFSPLHHKLMNYLERRVKKKHVEHAKI